MICIEFGNNGISVLCVKEQSGGVVVEKFARMSLDNAIYENAIIRNMAECAKTIGNFLQENGFRDKEVGVLLHIPAVSRELSLPYTKNQKQMRVMVQSEIAASYTTEEEYLLQYSILSLEQLENATMAKIIAYLMPRLIIESYRRLLTDMKKKAVFFDVAQNALLKATNLQPSLGGGGPYIVVKLTEHDVAVHLLDGKGSILTRTAQISKKNPDIVSFGINLLPDDGGTKEEEVYDMAAQQISKMLQFYSIKAPGTILGKVYLCGDILKPQEACAQVQTDLAVEVEMLPQPRSVASPAGFHYYNWVTLVGAMLRK